MFVLRCLWYWTVIVLWFGVSFYNEAVNGAYSCIKRIGTDFVLNLCWFMRFKVFIKISGILNMFFYFV